MEKEGDLRLGRSRSNLLWGSRRIGMRYLLFTCLGHSSRFRNSVFGCSTKLWPLIVTDNGVNIFNTLDSVHRGGLYAELEQSLSNKFGKQFYPELTQSRKKYKIHVK
ncbi:unnamed protein product [Ixodes pacificus]